MFPPRGGLSQPKSLEPTELAREAATQNSLQEATATPDRVGLLQRKCACASSPVSGGECEDCSNKKHSAGSEFRFAKPVFQPPAATQPAASVIQTKLKVGEAHDKFEQEADRTADAVMRMRDGEVRSTTPLSPKPHRIPGETGGHAPEVELGVGSRINTLRNGGQPLPQSLRAFFEPRFNVDFSSVRVHTGPEASRSARNLGARAFTVGSDIVVGAGEYAPGETAGRNLLAHELTHVVQQSSAPNPGGVQLKESPKVRRQKIDQSCAGREADISEGFDHARRLTSDTIDRLEFADDLMGQGLALSWVNPSLATTIQNAFGSISEFDSGAHSLGEVVRSQPVSSGQSRIARLIGNYRKVADALRNENVRVRCDTAEVLKQENIDKDFCESHGAFVIRNNANLKNDVFLCPNFLRPDTTPSRRGLFLLHEMSHSALGILHEGGEIHDFSCGPLGFTFKEAMKNAYAYEILAECLHREEFEMTKGEDVVGKTPALSPKKGDRQFRLSLGVAVSPSEERVLRRFASLSLDVPWSKSELPVFSPSFGFKLLSLPGSTVKEEHIAAAMIDIGVRFQRPLRGVYLDIEGGVFAGGRFEPGKELKGVVGLGATLGVGYRFKNFEIGAQASFVDPVGDDSRVYFVGKGALRF